MKDYTPAVEELQRVAKLELDVNFRRRHTFPPTPRRNRVCARSYSDYGKHALRSTTATPTVGSRHDLPARPRLAAQRGVW